MQRAQVSDESTFDSALRFLGTCNAALFGDSGFARVGELLFGAAFESEAPEGLLVFDLLSDTLEPRTEEARFHLAMTLLWQHEYALAAKYLRGYGVLKRPFNQYKQQPLQKDLNAIVTLVGSNKDHDPRARAVRLLAYYLIARQLADFPQEGQDFTLAFAGDYLAHLQDRRWVGEALLTTEEELFLAEALPVSSQVQDRINLLKVRQGNGYLPRDISDDSPLTEENPLRASEAMKGFSPPGELGNFEKSPDWTEPSMWSYLPSLLDFGSSRLLKPDPLSNFALCYAAARGELDDSEMKRAIHSLVGVPPAWVDSSSNLRSYWWEALQFSRDWESSESTRMAMLLLMQVSKKPEEYPSLAEWQSDRRFGQQLRGVIWPTWSNLVLHALEDYKKDLEQPVEVSDPHPLVSIDQCILRQESQHEQKTFQELCAAPEAFESIPLVPHVGAYILERPLNDAEKRSVEEISKDLIELFNISSNDSLITDGAHKVREELRTFGAQAQVLDKQYEVVDAEGLFSLSDTLKKQLPSLEEDLKAKQEEIERLALKYPEKPEQHSMAVLGRMAGIEKPLLMQELVQLYATQDVALMQARNPALSPDEAIALYQKVGRFLVAAVHHQHLQRTVDMIEQYRRVENPDVSHVQELIAKIYRSLNDTRRYDIKEHPAYLSFEYTMQIMLRPEQVEKLDLLQLQDGKIGQPEKLGIVLEMIMGAGKTKVLLPLLGQLIADGERLAIVVMPEFLLPSMSDDLQESLGEAFGMGSEVVRVDRYVGSLDANRIAYLHSRFENARKSRRIVMMTNSSVQSLYLSFLLRLKQYQELLNSGFEPESIKDLAEVIEVYRKIFRLFKGHATVVIDEIDYIMDVLRSHHYATGQRKPAHSDVLLAVTGLYELLEAQPELRDVLQLPFLGAVGASPFTEENYRALLKPRIVETVIDGHYLSENKRFQAFLSNVKEGAQATRKWLKETWQMHETPEALLKSYLLNRNDPEVLRFIENIADDQIHNILAVLQEELTTVFPLTAKKQVFVHYGPKVGTSGAWAVPYYLGKASERSDFGTELETINFTIQMYLEQGVDRDIVEREVNRLKVLLDRPFVVDKAREEAKQLVGDTGVNLNNLTDRAYELLVEQLKKQPKLLLKVIDRHVLPLVRSYDEQLEANGQIFGFLFDVVHGFTGTLWNVETFPKVFESAVSSDTRERTLFTLWATTPKDVQVLNGNSGNVPSVLALVEALAAGQTDPLGSLIDLAGLFRGVNAQDVAKAMLDARSTSNGVIFYNEQDDIMVLEPFLRTY